MPDTGGARVSNLWEGVRMPRRITHPFTSRINGPVYVQGLVQFKIGFRVYGDANLEAEISDMTIVKLHITLVSSFKYVPMNLQVGRRDFAKELDNQLSCDICGSHTNCPPPPV